MSENGFATADSILGAASERRYRETTLWNGQKVYLRSLFENEFSVIDSAQIDTQRGGLSKDGMRLTNVRLVIASVCGSDKQPLFSEQKHLRPLLKSDTIFIEPTVREIREHCGLRTDMEELVKNSALALDDDSPCSSAEPSPTA